MWVVDLANVLTWSGRAYVAFVVDDYARRNLGWRVATTMNTAMVLDCIEQAIWTREREGIFDLKDVVHHTDRGSYTRRSDSPNASPKPESNRRSVLSAARIRKPWRSVQEVEYATAEWVDWFNNHRLYEYCGDIAPVEMETAH